LLVVLVALLHFWLMGRPLSASISAPLTTLIIGAAALAGAFLGWRYKAGKHTVR
jgi:CHASE2 domain-containing sensor protein